MNKKVLILTMTCGEGHNSIARTMQKSLKSRGIDSSIVDIYRSRQRELDLNNKGYLFVKKHFANAYNIIWNYLKKSPKHKANKSPIHRYIRNIKSDINNEITSYKPNAIVCCHVYCSALVQDLYDEGFDMPPMFSIVSDFLPHPFWECGAILGDTNQGYIIIPHDLARGYVEKLGWPKDNIKTIGIPVQPEFEKQVDKKRARQKLGFSQSLLQVGIISGGDNLYGALKLVKILRKSNLPIELHCMCSKNKKNFKKITSYAKRHKLDFVHAYGFLDSLHDMFSALDVMVSAGGCVSICEAMTVGLPLIIREKMIINEQENKEILISNGCALGLNTAKDIVKTLRTLCYGKSKLDEMAECQKKFINTGGTQKLTDFIEEKLAE